MTRARRVLVAFYIIAAAAGAIVPYAILIPGAARHGVDVGVFVGGLFVNPAASIFAADALMASVVFIAFVVVDGRRADMTRLWVYPLLMLAFGLACAMPLFLAMRERARSE